MRVPILLCLFSVILVSCGRSTDQEASPQGTSGNGAVYGRGGGDGKDDVQRARETATDTRPRGGSMPGAGGAGPGYDGSRQGTTEKDFVPAPGSGFASGLTNSNAAATNQRPSSSQSAPVQQR